MGHGSRKKKSGKKKRSNKGRKQSNKQKMGVSGAGMQPTPPSMPQPAAAAPPRGPPPPARTDRQPTSEATAVRAAPKEEKVGSDSSSGGEDNTPTDDRSVLDMPAPKYIGPANTGFNFINPDEEKKTKPAVSQGLAGAREQTAHDDEMFKVHRFPSRTHVDINQGLREDTDVFCAEYSRDGNFLAAGCGDGSIRCFNSGGKLAYHFGKAAGADDALPITCLRFRPSNGQSQTQHVLLAACADGTVSHWHMPTNSCIFTIEEDDNQVYAVDYRADGERFATAGQDTKVRVYDEATKALVSTMSRGRSMGIGSKGVVASATGHSNRVYSVKFMPGSPDVMLSGGWDNTVQIWDLRSGQAERSIYGPHICGDALDVSPDGTHVLTGSWKPEKALQVWDFGTGHLVRDVQWQKPVAGKGRPEMLYSVRYSANGRLVGATGTGTREMKLFDVCDGYTPIDRVSMGGAYSCCFAPNGRQCAVGGEGGALTTIDITSDFN